MGLLFLLLTATEGFFDEYFMKTARRKGIVSVLLPNSATSAGISISNLMIKFVEERRMTIFPVNCRYCLSGLCASYELSTYFYISKFKSLKVFKSSQSVLTLCSMLLLYLGVVPPL